MRRVVDSRILLKVVSRRKPTVSSGRKAAVLGATWRVPRTPPGSESRACMHRGDWGTWENHLSPCHIPGQGDRATKDPGMDWGRPRGREPMRDTTNATEARKGLGSERRAKPPETGREGV